MTSIIIVTYKNPPLLRLCLSHLIKTLSSGFDHEIIVVDSQSTPETANIVLEEYKKVKLFSFWKNIGYSQSVNIGLKNSRGDQIFICNADVLPKPGSLERLSGYLNSNLDVGLCGPKLLNIDGTKQNSFFKFFSVLVPLFRRTFLGKTFFGRKYLSSYTYENEKIDTPTDVNWLMGAALMASRSAINKVGYMDESFFIYMSDVDWPLYFRKHGFRVVYYPEAEMYHYHMRSSKRRSALLDIVYNKYTRAHIKDAFRYFKKHGILAKG